MTAITARSSRATLFAFALLFATLASTGGAHAVSTETWVREDATFRVGKFFGTIVSPGGELRPGLDRFLVARPDTGIVWDLVLTDELLYAATGARGGMLRWDGEDLGAALAERDGSPEMFAAVQGKKNLYIATGPSGSVFEANEKEKEIRELMRPDAEYVWDLALLSTGELIVATGIPGRVLLIDPEAPEEAEVLWRTDERHVRALAVDENDVIYAGTAGSGWLARIAPDESPFVIYDASEEEIVDVEIAPDGAIWLLAAGAEGGAAPAAPAAKSDAGNASQKKDANDDGPSNGGEATKQEAATSEARSASRSAARGGGSVVRIAPGENPVTFWSDKSETPHALAPHPEGGMLIGTGTPARVWWLDDRGREGLWYAFEDSRAVSAIASTANRVAIATSNPASLWLFGPAPDPSPRWTSDVIDAASRATIGRVHAVASAADARGVEVALRVGNTAEPGPGWTDWVTLEKAAAPPAADGDGIELPASRFAQVQVSFDPERAPEGRVSRIELRYRPVNRAPEVKRVTVLAPGVAFRPVPPSSVTGGNVPVIELGVAEEAKKQLEARAGSWRSKKAYEPGALTLTWEAEDADKDTLRFRIDACREEGATCDEWIELADGLERSFFSFDSRTLDDGVYRFRVTADDGLDNYDGDAQSSDRLTSATPIDHTPPIIEEVKVAVREEGGLALELSGVDPEGRLARAEVASPDGEWTPIRPADGVEDGARESFSGVVSGGEETRKLTVRLIDAAGNVTIETVPVEP